LRPNKQRSDIGCPSGCFALAELTVVQKALEYGSGIVLYTCGRVGMQQETRGVNLWFAKMSSLVRNVPLFTSLEVSPFSCFAVVVGASAGAQPCAAV
jgi:hypothetical protein